MTTPTHIADADLPRPSCIVTNVGRDRPQSFLLSTALGVALMEQPVGTMLYLYTADQLRQAIKDWKAKQEVVAWQYRYINTRGSRGPWKECGSVTYESYKADPDYEVRSLIVKE